MKVDQGGETMSKKKKKYAARVPVGLQGGIRAQQPYAVVGRRWWNRRWTEAMEAFRLGARLGRGRSYAVSGQVSELTIQPGLVAARVQGAAAEPYACEIRLRQTAGEPRERLIGALRQRPMLLARLLTGDLPFEVESLFLDAGCPLFPRQNDDLSSRCACPDWANPCKHLVAVYYLLGEALSHQPLALLQMRGIGRSDLFPEHDAPAAADQRQTPPAERQPDIETFYGEPLTPPESFGAAPPPGQSVAPLIQRLGPLPLWRGQERFCDTLEHLYRRAASRGWAVWIGDTLDLRREDEKMIIRGATLRLRRNRIRIDSAMM